jgi:hypothetical protein
VSGHREVSKKLFTNELLDEEEDEDAPTISLHALTGIQPRSGCTIQVVVIISTAHLPALLNSGSTHNFMDFAAADHVGLHLTTQAGLHVAVANCDHVNSPRLPPPWLSPLARWLSPPPRDLVLRIEPPARHRSNPGTRVV